MTKEEWSKARDEELARWKERQLLLQQEYARELGVHQGRISIIDDQLVEEEDGPEIENQ